MDQLKQSVFSRLQRSIDEIKNILGDPSDLQLKEFVIPGIERDAALFYLHEIAQGSTIEKSIVLPLLSIKHDDLLTVNERRNESIHFLYKKIYAPLLNRATIFEEIIYGILEGNTVLLIDHCEEALIFSTKGGEKRSVDEPQTETVVRGPRDGFVESIAVNKALIRRRIKDPMLRMQGMQIGKRTKTNVEVAYIEGIVKDGLVEEVLARLRKIKIDAILESGYIEELIDDAPMSLFTTIQGTERPDKVAAGLLEGRVAILVDNTPFALLVPTHFWQFLEAADDHYTHFWMGTFFRFIRYIAFIISLTLPAIYVMLVTFHQEMIPTPLAITIAAGREVIPLPALFEAILMELAFELMREAGLRLPKPVGQAVSIVGSLIIGQAAVEAGLVSPIMVIIVATTGIASFAIPNYSASFSIRLVRFPILIAAGTLGLLGFATVFVVLLIHAISLRSFGEPYLAPIMPLNASDVKDTLVRAPIWSMDTRPNEGEKNQHREGESQKPSPNQKNGGN